MRRALAPVGVVACALGVSMGFSPIAAADWSRPWPVAPTGSAGDPLVAVAPGGGAHVGWVDGYEGSLRVRRVTSRGRLGRITTLAHKTSFATHRPWIAGAPSGALVAVWYVDVPTGLSLRMRRLTNRGELGPVRVVADSANVTRDPDSTRMEVEIHPDGSATVVWDEVRGHGVGRGFDITGATVHARRMGVDGRLGPMLDVAEAGEINPAPRVAAAPGGRATVIWQARTSTGTVIRTAAVDGNSTEAIRDIAASSPYAPNDGPGIFTNARGIGLAVWGDSETPDVLGRRLAGGAAKGPPFVIAPAWDSYGVTGVVDVSGKATVAWRQVGPPDEGFINQVSFLQVRANGSVAPVRALSAPHFEVSTPSLAVDRSGVVTTAWTTIQPAGDGYRYAVQARRIAADGRPGAVHTLERSQAIPSPPAVVSDRHGRALAVWSLLNRNGSALHAARYVAGCSKAQLHRRQPVTRCR